jgi:hypothetical protein
VGRIVIVAYRARPGKQAALRALVEKHVPLLREQGLAAAREPLVMEAADGTLIEVFEWLSESAIAAAHENAAVQALWADFASSCDYIPIAQVPEASQLFSEFSAFDPGPLG